MSASRVWRAPGRPRGPSAAGGSCGPWPHRRRPPRRWPDRAPGCPPRSGGTATGEALEHPLRGMRGLVGAAGQLLPELAPGSNQFGERRRGRIVHRLALRHGGDIARDDRGIDPVVLCHDPIGLREPADPERVEPVDPQARRAQHRHGLAFITAARLQSDRARLQPRQMPGKAAHPLGSLANSSHSPCGQRQTSSRALDTSIPANTASCVIFVPFLARAGYNPSQPCGLAKIRPRPSSPAVSRTSVATAHGRRGRFH